MQEHENMITLRIEQLKAFENKISEQKSAFEQKGAALTSWLEDHEKAYSAAARDGAIGL